MSEKDVFEFKTERVCPLSGNRCDGASTCAPGQFLAARTNEMIVDHTIQEPMQAVCPIAVVVESLSIIAAGLLPFVGGAPAAGEELTDEERRDQVLGSLKLDEG